MKASRLLDAGSIDVKSEDSILLEETVIRSHCAFKEICGALRVVLVTRPNSPVVSHERCGL